MFDLTGFLFVGGKEYTQRIVGRYVGLDLNQNLYLGGVPGFRTLWRSVGQRTGFIGKSCYYINWSDN